MSGAAGAVTLTNGSIEVRVTPAVGGTITSIRHVPTGLSVLGQVPWDAIEEPIASFAARDEAEWLTRYSGGWPLLFPNGGDACEIDGIRHGFHGEASISPWAFTSTQQSLRLRRRFYWVPVEMERDITLDGDVIVVEERLRMHGPRPINVMWGHHPTFGSDLLAGPVEISSGASLVSADADFDPDLNPLVPGGAARWPLASGKHGEADLSQPAGPMAALAYLHGFEQGWIAMRRRDDAIAVALSWDAGLFPVMWLWVELNGTMEAPWHGRTSLIGLEPNTTRPAYGLARARARGGSALHLDPGASLTTTLRLQVLEPRGAISSVSRDGRARFR